MNVRHGRVSIKATLEENRVKRIILNLVISIAFVYIYIYNYTFVIINALESSQ